MAVVWRIFGDSGIVHWPEGGLQIEQLTRAAEKPRLFTAMQKTMFDPSAFAAGIDHMPKAPRRTVRLVNAVGRRLDPGALWDPVEGDHRAAGDSTRNRKRHFPWQGAVIYHYAMRTRAVFARKGQRGDAMNTRHPSRYSETSRWFRAIDVNDVEERSIQRHLPEVKGLMERWRRRDPRLAELERAAFDDLRQDQAVTPRVA